MKIQDSFQLHPSITVFFVHSEGLRSSDAFKFAYTESTAFAKVVEAAGASTNQAIPFRLQQEAALRRAWRDMNRYHGTRAEKLAAPADPNDLEDLVDM